MNATTPQDDDLLETSGPAPDMFEAMGLVKPDLGSLSIRTPQEPSSISGGGLFPAVFTMHCPAGATNACVKHARGIENLFGRMFGLRIQATKAPEGSQCDNCVNEAPTSEAAP